jgi:hypothetical protein
MKTRKILSALVLFAFLISCHPSSTPSFEAPTVYKDGNKIVYEQRTNGIQSMGSQDRAGINIIYWNDSYWSQIDFPNRKFFILFHEVCHLQHPDYSESQASCCSARILSNASMLTDVEISSLAYLMLPEEAIDFLVCTEDLKK